MTQQLRRLFATGILALTMAVGGTLLMSNSAYHATTADGGGPVAG